jgi:eukaryotic-like serine/threonine-protein kinase
MGVAAGSRLGPYEVLAPLGAGGMGEVYRARDTRLNRTVAIKILPESLAHDPEFRERFDREARTISQLDHPNICAVYDVGEQDGTAFLVMQFLDGQTLADRLAAGALPCAEALAIAVQIAAALDRAHQAGIVHRDLKPGNVMLSKSGTASNDGPQAKLLDFGLAKSVVHGFRSATGAGLTSPPTMTTPLTGQGMVVGTFQYMAPEQIQGVDVDARADAFAFGAVLFEMITGQRAFQGKSQFSVMGAILEHDPPSITSLKPGAPLALNRVVQRCLAKDPARRWQSMADLGDELRWIASGGVAPTTPTPRRSRAVAAIAATALITAAIVGSAVWALVHRPVEAPRVVRLQATPPAAAPLFVDGIAPDIALSPDGTRIVYTAGATESRLYLRALDQNEAVPLGDSGNVRGPFFSPDGEWIGYFQGAYLKKVSVRGGPSITICGEAGGNRGASWADDDTIIFSAAGGTRGIRRVAAAGGEPVSITTVDTKSGEAAHLWPEALPDGRAVLFSAVLGTAIATSGENAVIVARDLRTGEQKTLVRGGSHPHFVSTGHLVYAVAGTLRAVRFDLEHLTVIGNPAPALDHVLTKAIGSADAAVSRNGSLVYVSGGALAGGSRLVWLDRHGREEAIPAPPRAYVFPRISPDGTRLALDIRDQQFDIWIWDFARKVLGRLTTNAAADSDPLWTPDSKRVVFDSQRAGAPNIYWQPADGSGATERLTTSPNAQRPLTFTSDGRLLLFREVAAEKNGPDIYVRAMEGDPASKPLMVTPFDEQNAELSPDGRWLAYQSLESSDAEIHVRPFPAVENGHWQISTNGGLQPLWARNGRELFYFDSSRRHIMGISVEPGSTFAASNPQVVIDLGDAGAVNGALGRTYDISPDGQRFLVILPLPRTTDGTSAPQVNVVLNWGEELKRLVPKQ